MKTKDARDGFIFDHEDGTGKVFAYPDDPPTTLIIQHLYELIIEQDERITRLTNHVNREIGVALPLRTTP